MKSSRNISISLMSGAIVFISLYLSIVVKLNAKVDTKVILAYLLISLFVGLVSYILSRFEIKYGAKLLLFASIVSGVFLYVSMPKTADGFLQLGAILSWLIILGSSIAALLIYAMISLILRYSKKSV